ncbi:hypothetical protein WMY93_021799 [Mugilogobius chulae]|uniref:PABC domain-containing protein n=1 Tax=Mugilogobius chulae TaxID=88201 RepID=A0AAW0NGB8_9GOBI
MFDEDDIEGLGEELYNRIYAQHKETAGKLTGMLLELPFAVLVQLLQDETQLTAAVNKAHKTLQEAQEPSKVKLIPEDNASTSSDSLGEQLFELVELYNTGHSQKITGMLLEQQKDSVINLLSDSKLLDEQINQALETLKELFSLVKQINQDHANDITGMLLEMDQTALNQILCDRSMLEAAVQKALSALTSDTTAK